MTLSDYDGHHKHGTPGESVLDNLELNVSTNAKLIRSRGGSARAIELDWAQPEATRHLMGTDDTLEATREAARRTSTPPEKSDVILATEGVARIAHTTCCRVLHALCRVACVCVAPIWVGLPRSVIAPSCLPFDFVCVPSFVHRTRHQSFRVVPCRAAGETTWRLLLDQVRAPHSPALPLTRLRSIRHCTFACALSAALAAVLFTTQYSCQCRYDCCH